MVNRHHELLHKKMKEEKGQVKVPMKFIVQFLKDKKINTDVLLDSNQDTMNMSKTIENESNANVLKKSI